MLRQSVEVEGKVQVEIQRCIDLKYPRLFFSEWEPHVMWMWNCLYIVKFCLIPVNDDGQVNQVNAPSAESDKNMTFEDI